MTTTVQHTVTKPDGSPFANAEVQVALNGDGFSADGTTQVRKTAWGMTDGSGHIAFALDPTDTMQPSGCYYTWTNPDGSQYTFTVPSSGGPYSLFSRLVTPPPSLGSLGLTKALADSYYVPFQTTAPDHTVTPVWADSSTSPPTVKGWSGSAWVVIGGSGTTITDNGDGTLSA